MDRGIKQILWMSWTLRSRILSSNYIMSNRVSQNILQNYWTNAGDISWSEKLGPIKKMVQESETYSSKDFISILNAINAKRPKLDLKDAMNMLTLLVEITKENQFPVDLLKHGGFKILCEQIKQQVRLMSLTEVVNSIKLLTYLNVPASTLIMQSLLQIIRDSINDLHIDQIHILLLLLTKMESTSLSSALQIALPIVLPTIINTKLNYNSMHELSLALYHIKYTEQNDLITKICKSIQLIMKERNFNYSVHSISSIFCTLCYMAPNKFNFELLNTKRLIEGALFSKTHKLNLTAISECICAMSHSVATGNIDSFNPVLLNKLLEAAMSKSMKLQTGIRIQKYLNNMQYAYVPFIDYLLKKCPSLEISSHKLNVLLNAFSICDYKSIPWDLIEKKILQLTSSDCNFIYNLVQYTLCLASFDKYYPHLLSTVFDQNNLRNLMALENNKTYCEKVLCIYQSVKTLYTEYKGPWPTEEVLNYIYKKTYFSKKSLLKDQLESIIGGHQYMLRNLRTKIGHNIDYAIIMRKGGYPIAFNTVNSEVLCNYTRYVEELRNPPESYVILIIELPFNAYAINNLRLINSRRLQLKSLEKWTGHKCVDININAWKNLPSHEQSAYLMQKIKNECDDIVPDV